METFLNAYLAPVLVIIAIIAVAVMLPSIIKAWRNQEEARQAELDKYEQENERNAEALRDSQRRDNYKR